MFEQNNIGVRLKSPIATLIGKLTPTSPAVDYILDAAEKIVAALEGKKLVVRILIQ
jgi:hypothetical protein